MYAVSILDNKKKSNIPTVFPCTTPIHTRKPPNIRHFALPELKDVKKNKT